MTRPLTEIEINEIIESISIPFNLIRDNTDHINNTLRNRDLKTQLEEVRIYDDVYQDFKDKIIETFYRSLLSSGELLGINASDAICAQATQSNLNTFHKSGAAENTGIDGYNDLLSLTKKRSNKIGTIHFKNKTMSKIDVDFLSKEFIGVSVADFCKSIKLKYIDVNDLPYWYSKDDYLQIRPSEDQNTNGKRICISLELDKYKLFVYRFFPSDIVDKITEVTYNIFKLKNDNVPIYCVPSPITDLHIDIFVNKNSAEYDHLLSSITSNNILSNIFIKGIRDISTFYVVSKKINSLVRFYDKEKNHVYLNRVPIRTSGIPLWKLEDLMEAYGAKVLNKTYKYDVNMLTYSPLDREERIYMRVEGVLRQSPDESNKYINDLGGNISLESSNVYVFDFLPSIMNKESVQIKCEDIIIMCIRTGYKVLEERYLEESYSNILRYNIEVDDRDGFERKLMNQVEETMAEDEFYVHAEVIGNDLQSILNHPLVDKKMCFTNNFHQIKDVLGVNALRNYIIKALDDMISSSGSAVHPMHIQLIADSLTLTGLNPMTSTGISGQNRGGLSQGSIDKTKEFLLKQILPGKKESTAHISTSIIVGNPSNVGTGLIDVIKPRRKVIHNEEAIKFTEDANPIAATSTSVYPRFIKPLSILQYYPPEWFQSIITTKNVSWYLNLPTSQNNGKNLNFVPITQINSGNANGLVKAFEVI